MAARPVEETLTIPMENANPKLETVSFSSVGQDGDYYDCRKLSMVEGAFASNTKTKDKNIRVNFATLANGQVRVYLYPEENFCTGYLTIIGRK